MIDSFKILYVNILRISLQNCDEINLEIEEKKRLNRYLAVIDISLSYSTTD